MQHQNIYTLEPIKELPLCSLSQTTMDEIQWKPSSGDYFISRFSLLPKACSSYSFLQYLEPLPTLWLSSPANDNNNYISKFSSFGRGKKPIGLYCCRNSCNLNSTYKFVNLLKMLQDLVLTIRNTVVIITLISHLEIHSTGS